MGERVAGLQQPHPYFFTAAPFKLVLLSICSLGLYELYWFYKNWHFYRNRTGKPIKPLWRAFFSPLWAYASFKTVNEAAVEYGLPQRIHPVILAIAYFMFTTPGLSSDIFWTVSLLAFIPILSANDLAMRVNRQVVPSYRENDQLSRQNWAVMIIGGIVLVLAVIGTVMEPVD